MNLHHWKVDLSRPDKYISLIESIHMGVVSRTLTCQKKFPKYYMQYVKIELSNDVDFLHVGRLPKKQQIDAVISNT